MNKLDVIPDNQKTHSHVYPYIANLAPKVMQVSGRVVPLFQDTFTKFDDLLGNHTS
jgi:hypothetical protein